MRLTKLEVLTSGKRAHLEMSKLSPREGQKATLREPGSGMEAEAMSSQAGGLLQPNADLCLLQH